LAIVIEEEGGKRCRSGFSLGGFITTTLAYRFGKRLDNRKVYYPFSDIYLTTESGPSFTFETRHLGDSETIANRILRL
jgi:hypothetical protein